MVRSRSADQLLSDGFCIVPDVIDPEQCREGKRCLWAAAEESERRGAPTRNVGLDPNEHNVRVFNLLDLDPLFREWIQHPVAIELVTRLLGEGFLISNFTANIALPGARPMEVHSDQSIVVPEPWLAPWAINIIWCLDDTREANGATRYLPGSHRVTRRTELPADPVSQMKSFEAKAGSLLAVDGRMWHTSGANTTEGEERALLFGYYSADFLRPQTNWNAALSPATLKGLSPRLRTWLGVNAEANIRLADPLVLYAARGDAGVEVPPPMSNVRSENR